MVHQRYIQKNITTKLIVLYLLNRTAPVKMSTENPRSASFEQLKLKITSYFQGLEQPN